MDMSIGLAMIVRDAEDTLGPCLQSVRGMFDQVVVVDTGSTDRTAELAADLGAEVHHFTWVYDFAAARNYSFDLLKTEWAFWLDADDVLVGREHFHDMLAKIDASPTAFDGIGLEYLYAFDPVGEQMIRNALPEIVAGSLNSSAWLPQLKGRCTTIQWRERLIRNTPNMRWKYPIHEALPLSGRIWGKYDKISIVHRRHERKDPYSKDRNLDILLRQQTRDERIWMCLGMEYAHHARLDEAIDAFQHYLPLSTVQDELYMAQTFLGDIYRAKKDYDQALGHYAIASGLRPTWRDAWAGMLKVAALKEDWERALYYGSMAQQGAIPSTPFATNPMHQAVNWISDYCRALLKYGRYPEALELLEQQHQLLPENQDILTDIDSVTAAINTSQGIESVASAVEFFLRNDDAETAAVILGRLHPTFAKSDVIKPYVTLTSSICGPAVSGKILEDQFKHPPWESTAEYAGHRDPRMDMFIAVLSSCPEIRRILIVGGPKEMADICFRQEIRADISYTTEWPIDELYDGVMLWSCLERVKYPEQLVERARQSIRPGGWLMACVPNGPAKRGVAPPSPEYVRLRAYSIDGFRQVMGTVRMPVQLTGWSADAGDLFLAVPSSLPARTRRTMAIVCPFAPEAWGPWSLGRGIGGSEEAVIRLSRAFVKRGHFVTVYGSGWVGVDGQVKYEDLKAYRDADVLLGWRYPEIYSQIRSFDAEWKALWLHDSIQPQRVAQAAPFVDAIWCISDYHAGLYRDIPKIYSGRNGIDAEDFQCIEAVGEVERNPYKMVYVSSPFRGLDHLLADHWPQIRARVPRAELHVYYGWDSADKMGATASAEGKALKERITELVQQPGVVWRGRVGQPELYRELLTAGVWTYPTSWHEEHCISAYLAQAGGAFPVVYPKGALPQSVVFGWKTEPDGFVDAVVEATRAPGRQEMMAWARKWLSWDDVASLWERLWLRKGA